MELRLDIEITHFSEVGKLRILYVVFRVGTPVVETIEFRQGDLCVLVDRGKDNFPVSTQFIFDRGVADALRPGRQIDQKELAGALLTIFMISTQMVAYHDAQRQRLGNELIKEAVQHLRLFPAEEKTQLSLP